MDYFATTQATASWLLGHASVRVALAKELPALSDDQKLARGTALIGQLRAAANPSGSVLAMWHVDYVSNTGAENWGMVRLSGQFGLLDKPDLLAEVFERYLAIVERRLQGFMLQASWQIRNELPDVTTCIAGRGEAWDRYRIAYVEGETPLGNAILKSVLVTGPAWENAAFRSAALEQRPKMHAVAQAANTLLAGTQPRPAIEHQHLLTVRRELGQPEQAPSSSQPLVSTALSTPRSDLAYATLGWTYEQWIVTNSPLTEAQRQVLTSDAIESQPIRLLGAAGSGKTLLMMLMAIRQLTAAKIAEAKLSVLYVAHNSAMRDKVFGRFLDLGAEEFLEPESRSTLSVYTLFDYATKVLNVPESLLIDSDAQVSKEHQAFIVSEVLRETFAAHANVVDDSVVFKRAREDEGVFGALVALVGDEFSSAIKGNGMNAASDKKQYVDSQRRLSRLHGILNEMERDIVWEVFLRYQERVADDESLLDADDLALSLLGRLRTPLWELRRRDDGYDLVFVDEAQLFNENERRLFPLLTKRRPDRPYVPVVLALDQAQQTKALASAGLGLLGLEGLESHTLRSVHRCTPAVLRLAFFMLQRTTDLFDVDFPDFTGDTTATRVESKELPRCIFALASEEPAAQVVRTVQEVRRRNLRQVAVVVFAQTYWRGVETGLRREFNEVRILASRGEALGDSTQPLVVLSRPEQIGGQEFDCVICVGLEQGVVPLRVPGNDALSAALEQQSLREMYLAFTRSRSELLILVTRGSSPNSAVADAIRAGLLEDKA